jgi:hypothetical protein
MPVLSPRFLRRSLPAWLGGVPATGGRYSSLPGGDNGATDLNGAPPSYSEGANEKMAPVAKPGVPLKEDPPSRAAVVGSVTFYLVAALVVRSPRFTACRSIGADQARMCRWSWLTVRRRSGEDCSRC